MTITVHLPEDIAQHENPGRDALEALAIEGFKSEQLSPQQASGLLGMGRLEFENFLLSRGVTDHLYGVEDLLQDIETGDRLRETGILPS